MRQFIKLMSTGKENIPFNRHEHVIWKNKYQKSNKIRWKKDGCHRKKELFPYSIEDW